MYGKTALNAMLIRTAPSSEKEDCRRIAFYLPGTMLAVLALLLFLTSYHCQGNEVMQLQNVAFISAASSFCCWIWYFCFPFLQKKSN
jgi:hypothetical protein